VGFTVDHSTIWVLHYTPILEKRIRREIRRPNRSWRVELRTIAGYEAINMIRKGQISWLSKNDTLGQVRFIEQTFGPAA